MPNSCVEEMDYRVAPGLDKRMIRSPSEPERRDVCEIVKNRYECPSRWHEQIGEPTLADGILDSLVHNAHRIAMKGDSMKEARKQSA